MQAVINQLRAEHRKLLNELQRLVKEHKKENGIPLTSGRKPGRQSHKNNNNTTTTSTTTSATSSIIPERQGIYYANTLLIFFNLARSVYMNKHLLNMDIKIKRD
jgi:hypothetical protein